MPPLPPPSNLHAPAALLVGADPLFFKQPAAKSSWH